jgi:hypothetical protein
MYLHVFNTKAGNHNEEMWYGEYKQMKWSVYTDPPIIRCPRDHACVPTLMVSLYLYILRHAYYNPFDSLFSPSSEEPDLSLSAKRLAKPFTYRQAVAGRCK